MVSLYTLGKESLRTLEKFSEEIINKLLKCRTLNGHIRAEV